MTTLSPILTKVEWEFGCAGLDGADTYCPPRGAGPIQAADAADQIRQGCSTAPAKRSDINALPDPAGDGHQALKGREPKHLTGFWNLYGDPTGMRSEAATTFIPEALATGKCELRPDSYCVRVLTNADRRGQGRRLSRRRRRRARARRQDRDSRAGAIESARLLLLSKPRRLSARTCQQLGLVGKNATFHEYLYAVGLFDREVHGPFDGYAGNYISGGTMQFYETDEKRGHINGSIIGASQVGHPINWMLPGRPAWGEAAKQSDIDYFRHSMKVGLCLHDIPVETNRVDLDPMVKDAWGLPGGADDPQAASQRHGDGELGNWKRTPKSSTPLARQRSLPVYPTSEHGQHVPPAWHRAHGLRP